MRQDWKTVEEEKGISRKLSLVEKEKLCELVRQEWKTFEVEKGIFRKFSLVEKENLCELVPIMSLTINCAKVTRREMQ